MRDFRKWQWSILGLMLVFNLGPLSSLFSTSPESFRIVVEEPQVERLQDDATGELSYVVEIDSDDLPFRRRDEVPLPLWAAVNAALMAAFTYTRYRMWRAKRESSAIDT